MRKTQEYKHSVEYDNLQKKHLELLEQKEREKEAEIRAKIQNEKESRDKQLEDEKRKKKFTEKELAKQEEE